LAPLCVDVPLNINHSINQSINQHAPLKKRGAKEILPISLDIQHGNRYRLGFSEII